MPIEPEGDLFSNDWFRVSDLKVSLHQHTSITRHIYRNQVWHVLQNHVSGQSYRFNEEVYRLIALMDGQRSLNDIWLIFFTKMDQKMPTQDDLIKVVLSLFHADLVRFNKTPDIKDLFQRYKKAKKQKILQYIKSPLGIKVSLFDPEKFLTRTQSWISPFFHPFMGVIWIFIVTYGVFLANLHWESLVDNTSDKIFSVENFVIMIFVYPIVKIFHELGHAYSVKRGGGEVHEIGVMFLIFYPIPYVDASAAIAFKNKYQRMLVGAAGILVELFIAAIAMLLWSISEPSLFRAVMYNVLLITGVSTILFNGNPLLKFDAYFVLSDWLEIPNLGQKSNQYLAYLVQYHLLGIFHITSPSLTQGEAKWLISYGIASYLYRLFLMITIVVFIATKYLFIGILLGLWSIYQGLVHPIIKGGSGMWKNVTIARKKPRLIVVSLLLLFILGLTFFIIPFPYATQAEGIVSVPEHSDIRVLESGFVSSSAIKNGKIFQQGDLLLNITSPNLLLKIKLLQLQLSEINQRIKSSFNDQSSSGLLQEERYVLIKRLEQLKQRQLKLQLLSEQSGLLITHQKNLTSHYIKRGESVGQLIHSNDYLFIRALVDTENIDNVRHHLKQIELRFSANSKTVYIQKIIDISPSSLNTLPSEILSINGGGNIATETASNGTKITLRPFYHIEISLPKGRKHYINERVYIIFRHFPEALYIRLYASIRRFFLRYFNA